MSSGVRHIREQRRPCPFHGCKTRVIDAMFACKKHWFQLEPWEREGIAMATRQRRAGEIDDNEMRRRQQELLGNRGRV